MSSCDTNVCGTGGWNGPLPGDPDNNSVLSASPAFGGIDVSWSYPGTNPEAVAHVILWRGITSEFAAAIQHRIVTGNYFYDRTTVGETYYYWIQIVSVHGTVGDPIGPASATARALIQDLIEQLTQKIDSGVLATSLRNELDQISVLNENLLNEILDRQTGETSFAEALEAVNAGVAEALTFIQTEINSRVSANEAFAESLDFLAVTLGDNVAAVVTTTSAWIEEVDGKVTDIGALYTAKVTVNGLIGGFGIYNDGTEVEAGFDVDTFWVGRTNADKRKPFIIVGGETFIDQAVINKLTFSKLTDELGSFVVEGGKIKADYLKVATASIEDAAITNAKIGNAAITSAKIGNAQVDTLQIAGQAVTIPMGAFTAGDITPGSLGDPNGTLQTLTIASTGAPILICASCIVTSNMDLAYGTDTVIYGIRRNGTPLADTTRSDTGYGKTLIAPFVVDTPGAGTHTYTLNANSGNTFGSRSLFLLELKR